MYGSQPSGFLTFPLFWAAPPSGSRPSSHGNPAEVEKSCAHFPSIFMPLYRVMTLYFVKFNVKISIIIDYLRNSYYLCNLIYHFQALHLPSPIESWQKTNTYKHLHNPSRSLISDNRLNPKNWRNSVLSCRYF